MALPSKNGTGGVPGVPNIWMSTGHSGRCLDWLYGLYGLQRRFRFTTVEGYCQASSPVPRRRWKVKDPRSVHRVKPWREGRRPAQTFRDWFTNNPSIGSRHVSEVDVKIPGERPGKDPIWQIFVLIGWYLKPPPRRYAGFPINTNSFQWFWIWVAPLRYTLRTKKAKINECPLFKGIILNGTWSSSNHQCSEDMLGSCGAYLALEADAKRKQREQRDGSDAFPGGRLWQKKTGRLPGLPRHP